VAQVLEHLPSKCEALSSEPGTAEREREKRRPQKLGLTCSPRRTGSCHLVLLQKLDFGLHCNNKSHLAEHCAMYL
jgi:hypothetical protein